MSQIPNRFRKLINRLSPPDYYPIDFTPDELSQIAHHCDPVNEKLSKFCPTILKKQTGP